MAVGSIFLKTYIICGGIHFSSKFYQKKINKSSKKRQLYGKNNILFKPFTSFMSLHRQQLAEISSGSDEKKHNTAEKEINRDISIAIGSLICAGAGYAISPYLSIVSLVGNIYLTAPSVKVAYFSLRERKTFNIDTLTVITMGIGLSMHYYVWCSIANVLYVTSKKLLLKIKDDSQKNLIDVFSNRPDSVWILVDNSEIERSFASLKIGDIVVVRAGETIPADGQVTDGMAYIDQHILTGELQPVEKEKGDEVFASTIVLTGRILIKVFKTGEETTVEQIGQMLNHTAQCKTNLQLHAETLTDKTVLPTLVAGLLSLPLIGLMGTAALLNAHFGYRLLVIAPIGILNFFHIMSQHGILVKDGRIFDLLGKVDTLVFDKTGTLTENQPHVGEIHTFCGYKENDILALATAAEHRQTHPVALAVIRETKKRKLTIPQAKEAEYKLGYGIKVTVGKQLIRVGSFRFMQKEDITMPLSVQNTMALWHNEGHSVVMVAVNNILVGMIELVPTIRSEAKSVIKQLKKNQIKSVYIISGDHENPTRKLAESLDVDHYYAETLPNEKANIIKNLQSSGKVVCYVGDGINDTIALKTANVSISLCGASTAAVDTAQVILMHEDLSKICELFEFVKNFKRNFSGSFAAILIPSLVGAFGAFFLHFTIVQTILLKQVGLIAGLSNTMLPLMKYKANDEKNNL